MNWIVVLAIEAVTIFFIVRFSWFRDCLLIIIILAGALLYYIDFQQRRENEAASIRISPNEIELTEVKFSDPFAQSSSNEITGRVRNYSNRYELDTLYLKVQLVDTYEDRSKIIGDDEVSLWVDVPPQQVRNFKVHPNFGTLKSPKGKWNWSCSISLIKGVVPEHHISNALNSGKIDRLTREGIENDKTNIERSML
jgi:hypothetical protein